MKDKTLKSFIILALNTKDTNEIRRNVTEGNVIASIGLPYKTVHGQYTHTDGKVVNEQAYLLSLPDADTPERATALAAIDVIARNFGQESVLFVDSERRASLVYTETGKVEFLGDFTSVPKTVAKKAAAYTYCPERDLYYVCL